MQLQHCLTKNLHTGNAFDLISDIGLAFGPSIFNDLTEIEPVSIFQAYYSSRKLAKLSWKNLRSLEILLQIILKFAENFGGKMKL